MAYESNKGNKPYSNKYVKGIGNAVRDPKRISGKGKANVVVVRVAMNSMALDREGNEIERSEFIDLKMFYSDADRALHSITTGTRVKFEGWEYPKEGYENREGEWIEESEINVERNGITLIPSDGKEGSRGDGGGRGRGRSRSRDEDEDEAPRSRGRGRSRSRTRDPEPEDDFDEQDDFDEEVEDDLGLEDDEPAPRSRSRSRSRSRTKKEAEVDDDGIEDYTQNVI